MPSTKAPPTDPPAGWPPWRIALKVGSQTQRRWSDYHKDSEVKSDPMSKPKKSAVKRDAPGQSSAVKVEPEDEPKDEPEDDDIVDDPCQWPVAPVPKKRAKTVNFEPPPAAKNSSDDSEYDDESQEPQIEARSFADAFGWVTNLAGDQFVMLNCNSSGFHKYENLKEMLSYANAMAYDICGYITSTHAHPDDEWDEANDVSISGATIEGKKFGDGKLVAYCKGGNRDTRRKVICIACVIAAAFDKKQRLAKIKKFEYNDEFKMILEKLRAECHGV